MPSETELAFLLNNWLTSIHVTNEIINSDGLMDDPGVRKVVLIFYSIGDGIALFQIENPLRPSPDYIPYNQLFEMGDFENGTAALQIDQWAVDCGYNGTSDREIREWQQSYLKYLSPERKAVVSKEVSRCSPREIWYFY